MKKKIFLSMIISVLFSLTIAAILVITISNREYVNNVKQNLKMNNDLIVRVLESGEIRDRTKFFSESLKNENIRETLIDKNGKVLSDSLADTETLDNHNTRIEVIDARKYGTGYSIRYSNSTRMDTLYYATEFGDGYIVRSAVPMESISLMESTYIRYYLLIMLVSLLITLLFSSRLSKALVRPLKNLESVTSKFAHGEFAERAKITANDEIGDLGKTFNEMADKLDNAFKDSKEKQTKLETVLISMDSGVIAIDNENRIILINPYAEKIFGIKKNIIGEKLLNTIRDFQVEDIIKNKEDNREVTIYWPEKRELKIRTAELANEKESLGIVAVIHDITDVKKLENMRSQFATNVTHELKTPLTSIKGFAETLKDVDDSETREKFLNIINDEAERLSRLINDILSLSKIENIRSMISDQINVNESISQVVVLLKSAAESKNINIKAEGDKIPVIYGDRDMFLQMLLNLADNAVKYSGRGTEVIITTRLDKETIVISVKDNGIGIAKEHLGRLFERFYRVDPARSREQGGTGLGLAIVKHIVLAFKGTIEVESVLGEGSVFTIRIPIK
ncbi:MAG: ATP-binding protein [Clostridiaceae bacterium]